MGKALRSFLSLAFIVGNIIAFDECKDKKDGTRLPHPADCGLYFICEGSRAALVGNCPYGLHFNRKTSECDFIARAGCIIPPLKRSAKINDISNDLNICEGKPDNSLQQYPGDCSKYVRCQGECAVEIQQCASGQLWNPAIQCCDTACKVDCPGSGYPCRECSNDLTVCEGKPDNSLQQYPGDCSKYVRCQGECAVEIQQCASGQLWNPAIQRCDTACKVDCPGSGYPCRECSNDLTVCEGKPDNSLQQYPGDCSKYVRCQGECAVEIQQCASGQLWNPAIQCCDTACKVDCPGSGYPCRECSNNLTVCEGEPDNSLQQYPGDCSKYVRCQGECAVEIQQCASGQLWNPAIQCCDTACKVDCPGSGYPCRECSNNLTVCEGEPDNSLQQYPGDCSKYVRCQGECAVEIQQCSSGQLWNPAIQRCDTACKVDCPGSGYPCKKCSNDLTVCEGKPDNSLQQYPGDCSKYVRCQGECAVEIQQCASGQLWNPAIQCCDTACKVDCPGSGYPCRECSNNLTVCEGEPDNSLQQYPGDCSKYVRCQGECAVEIQQCASGQLWNPAIQRCDTACKVDCPGSGYPCRECSNNLTVCEGEPDNSLQQYPGDCSKYVRCQGECAVEIQQCASGQLWNPAIQCCDTACKVDCPGSGYPCRECSNNLTVCEGEPDNSLQQYPGDCSKYVRCQGECAVEIQQCASGQLWNPAIQCCDTACKVDCPGSGYPCRECSNNLTVCEGEPDNSLQQYPGDCSKYVRCQGECAVEIQQCASGQLWNPAIQCCDTACKVDCPGSGYPCRECSNNLTVCEGEPDNSLQPYPGDCSKYVRCQGDCAVEIQQCGKGLLWNPSTQRCDTACKVDCPGSGYPCKKCSNDLTVCEGKPDNSLQQYPGDCSKYVRCQGDCAVEIQQCASGQLWNPSTQRCDTACKVDCPGSGYPCRECSNDLTVCEGKPDNSLQQYPGDCSKYVRCQGECAVEIQQCASGQLWNPAIQCCDTACKVDCPGSGYPCRECSNNLTVCEGEPDNSLQQYPGDCSKYVRCQGDCAVEIQQCASGQLWNPAIQCCDTACKVDCPGSGYPCRECSNDLTVCDGKPDNSLHPYPGDCSKYVRCQGDCAVEIQQCGNGQLWNPSTQRCDTACKVDCPGSGYPCRECSNNLTVCQGKPDNSLQQYPGDCSKYVRCQGECAVEIQQCGKGLLWNPSTQRCDTACNVDCPGSGYPCSRPPRPPGPAGPSGHSCDSPGKCLDKEDGTMFKDENSNGFIVCQCECEILRSCPPGLVFNEALRTCDWPAYKDGSNIICPPGLVFNSNVGICDNPPSIRSVKCSNNSPICKNLADGSLLPVEGVCDSFFVCSSGCALEKQCPNRLIFNNNTNSCDFPQNFTCPWPYAPPAGPSAGPSGIACENGGRCAEADEGAILPSTTKCSSYVVCQCGCEVEVSCPANLNFDATIKICNYKELVQCNI